MRVSIVDFATDIVSKLPPFLFFFFFFYSVFSSPFTAIFPPYSVFSSYSFVPSPYLAGNLKQRSKLRREADERIVVHVKVKS